MNKFYFLFILALLTLAGSTAYAQVFGIRQGGTANSTYPANTLVFFNGTQFVSTSTQPLYVGSVFATTTATSTFNGGIGGLGLISAPYFFASSTSATSTFAGNLLISGTAHLWAHGIQATDSGGIHFHANNGTEIGYMGVANTANTTWYGTYLSSGVTTDVTTGTNEHYVIAPNGTGFVGIASTTPGTLLSLGTSNGINISPTGTSTFNGTGGGINIATGCFAIAGTCVTGSGGAGTPGGTDGQVQYNNSSAFGGGTLFIWDDTNNRLGIGTSSPYAKLSVVGPVVSEYFHATSTTATSTLAGGTLFGAYGTKYEYGSDTLKVNNLESGPMYFDTDAGIVSWIDVPISSSSADNTVHSYTASIDGNPLLTLYGQANGSGGADTFRVGIGTTTPYSALSVVGQVVASNYVGTTTATSTLAGPLELSIASAVNKIPLYVVQNDATNDPLVSYFKFDGTSSANVSRWETTNTGANGPYLELYHNSSSPSTSDTSGFEFTHMSTAGVKYVSSAISGGLSDITNTTEDGRLVFYVTENGVTYTERLELRGNENAAIVGDGDGNAIVRSAGTHDLILNAGSGTTGAITLEDAANGNILLVPNGTGKVGVGTTTPMTLFTVSAGASATTTITWGGPGDTTSKTCVNMKDNLGATVSWYIVGGVMVIESGLCK